MQYNDDAKLDTSAVQDARSGGVGKGGLAIGGGGLGIVGVIVVVLLNVLGGGGSSSAVTDVLGQLGASTAPATVDDSTLKQECQTGKDANTKFDCAISTDIQSIQEYWTAELPKLGKQYVPADTKWFTGQVSTGCGAASSAAGPFYCPPDKLVYIDLTFYDDLRTQFGAIGGLFVDAYVLAHEYGHHVQNLLGTEAKVKQGETGPTSGSVRLELQADCYAGVWANHASTVPDSSGKPLISNITQEDFANALDTAGKIGDDYIQTQIQHQTFNAGSETHGTAAQRQKWLTTGYQTGDPTKCDTFSTSSL
jgi:predicted metalloprotease